MIGLQLLALLVSLHLLGFAGWTIISSHVTHGPLQLIVVSCCSAVILPSVVMTKRSITGRGEERAEEETDADITIIGVERQKQVTIPEQHG